MKSFVTVLLLVLIAASGLVGAYRHGLRADGEPGVGLFPFIASAMLFAFTLPRLAHGRTARMATRDQEFNRRRLGFYVASFAGIALLFDVFGFPITTSMRLPR